MRCLLSLLLLFLFAVACDSSGDEPPFPDLQGFWENASGIDRVVRIQDASIVAYRDIRLSTGDCKLELVNTKMTSAPDGAATFEDKVPSLISVYVRGGKLVLVDSDSQSLDQAFNASTESDWNEVAARSDC